MSQVVTLASEKLGSIPQLREELANKPLSQALRRGTWSSHEQAEYSEMEQALVQGKLKVEAYRELLGQTYPVYRALETAAVSLADHPLAGAVIDPALNRSEKVEVDLAYYYGADWRDHIDPLPITAEYVARIEEVAATEPVRYISHHYTRYLADLSGGLFIDRAIKGAYGLDQDGRRLYDFSELGDADEFKKRYRSTLDGLDVTLDEKVALVEEAMIAYEFNIQTIKTLSEALAPITTEELAEPVHH